MKTLVATAFCFLCFVGSAKADGLVGPEDGVRAAGGAAVTFSWIDTTGYNHDGPEFRVAFAKSPDPRSAEWNRPSLGMMILSRIARGPIENSAQTHTMKIDSRLTPGTWYWGIYQRSNLIDFGQASPPLRSIVVTSQASPGAVTDTAPRDIKRKVEIRYPGATDLRVRGCKRIGLVKLRCRTAFGTKRFRYQVSSLVERLDDGTHVALTVNSLRRR